MRILSNTHVQKESILKQVGNQLTVTDYEGNVKNYTYDGLNQLISYSDDENIVSYTYRMDGMRHSKTVNGTTSTYISGLAVRLLQI